MKRHLLLLAALVGFSPGPGMAQGSDLAYCNQLYDLAVRYRSRPIMGDNKPEPDSIVALEQCKRGDTRAGIATLEKKLRSADISLPPR